jgi:hypothetical protein
MIEVIDMFLKTTTFFLSLLLLVLTMPTQAETAKHESNGKPTEKGTLSIFKEGEIVGTKVLPIAGPIYIRKDNGAGAAVSEIDNIHVTVYRVKHGPDRFSTHVLIDFHMGNYTQNDKDYNKAEIAFNLKGSTGNIVTPGGPINVDITQQRRTCSPQNPVTSGPHIYEPDIYDQINTVDLSYHFEWYYEGSC